MTKTELIAAIAEKADLPKATVAQALAALPDTIVESLNKGEKVSWSGLGTFDVSERAARTGRNPQTGAAIQIAASKGVKFKAAKAFKDSLK
jgi:DNA-binding protein HU-beta